MNREDYLKTDAASLPPVDYPLFIEIPAWSQYYVELATRYTVPAVLA